MVYEWFGGMLCLDAVNTQMMIDGAPADGWTDFAALASWLETAQFLAPQNRREIEANWPDDEKNRVLEAAKTLRGAIRGLCEEIVDSRVSEASLDALNVVLERRATHSRIEREGETGFHWSEQTALDGEDILVPIARSAAMLLCERDHTLLKKCSNPGCILWFYDTTKNRGRRWCSMATCGNRHKAKAHYARQKS